ncbi:heme ABC transporter substrate-binding protein [Helicobacter sp. T3_23-1056]
MKNNKIVGKAMGQKIEKMFGLDKLKEGESKTITTAEIRKKIPEYPAKNGHPAFRDGSRNGQQIGFLVKEYNVKKHHKNPNNQNSEVVEFEISTKNTK